MNESIAARVRVKICGITNRVDAESAIALGADALGFNFFAGSKRCVSLDEVADWAASLPPFVCRVAVLVNATFDEARRVSEHPAIDLVQLHGDEDAAYCAAMASIGRSFIKALRVRDESDIESAGGFSTPHVLIDSHVEGVFGGTGARIDLALAAECVRRHPGLNVVLAGGLTAENVREAVQVVRPFAVDVASGVEAETRRKDIAKMRDFIAAVR